MTETSQSSKQQDARASIRASLRAAVAAADASEEAPVVEECTAEEKRSRAARESQSSVYRGAEEAPYYIYMPDDEDVPEDVVRVTIDPKVTEIEGLAFHKCERLESVHFPEDSRLEEVGAYAFQECTSLRVVNLPAGVTEIGAYAFQGCTSLLTATIPDGVETIGRSAFHGCSSLTSLRLPETLQEIEKRAFAECRSLSVLCFPKGLEEIGEHAFQGCTSLTAVVFPEGLQEVGGHAFDNCTRLVVAELASETTEVAETAFAGCPITSTDRWKNRFGALPLHRACYRANLDGIRELVASEAHRAQETDTYGLYPIQILASHPMATREMIRLVAGAYPLAVTNQENERQMTSLHFATLNPGKHVAGFLPVLTRAKTPHGTFGCALKNADRETPTVLAVKFFLDQGVREHLYACHQCEIHDFSDKFHKYRVVVLEASYVHRITSAAGESSLNFSVQEQHGWVTFAKTLNDYCRTILVEFLEGACPEPIVRELAYATNAEHQRAMDVAVPELRSVFCDLLLFYGRYEIRNDITMVVHRSDASVVVRASDVKCHEYYKILFDACAKGTPTLSLETFRIVLEKLNVLSPGRNDNEEIFQSILEIHDLNQSGGRVSRDEFVLFCSDTLNQGRFYREVAIKFMKYQQDFRREMDRRKELGRDSDHAVVEVIATHDFSNDPVWEPLAPDGAEDLRDYKYAIVTPLADRDLEAIARWERPNRSKLRDYARQLATKLEILHAKGIIHGNLKMRNVLRVQGNLVLADLDASSTKKCPVGIKFSSGILPPEMIYHCSNRAEVEDYQKYFAEKTQGDAWRGDKLAPKYSRSHNEMPFVVKTFLAESNGTNKSESSGNVKAGLPYQTEEATEAIDLWSFGTILYFLCAKKSLFEVDVNDDLASGDAMEKLCYWTDNVRDEVLKRSGIHDEPAVDLLRTLLSTDPSDRGTTSELLRHPFLVGVGTK